MSGTTFPLFRLGNFSYPWADLDSTCFFDDQHVPIATVRAEARREEAQAEADAISIRAEAKKKDMLAEAEGKRAITEAENALSEQIVAMKVDIARIDAIPGIMEQMVKPVEKIDSIKIHQVGGLGQGTSGGNGGGTAANSDKPVVNQALDSIMGMAVQMPALKKLGDELGMSLEDGIGGLADSALTGPQAKAKPAPDAPALEPGEDNAPGQTNLPRPAE